uniref:Hc38 n=3 Tax=Haemonchus contortus TaxID=6289 RepID=A0A7I5E6P6_HAECO|nr:Basic helix-loop-helix domain containing protein [Haemonchus contortus]
MSTKHLRRLIEEKELVQAKEDPEEEETVQQRTGPVNRFAAFIDDEDASQHSEESDAGNPQSESSKQNVNRHPEKEGDRKVNKKKNKKQKKKKVEEIDEEQLLEQLALENRSQTTSSEDYEPLGVDQVIKPDPRLFDAAAELKRALGKSFKMEATSSSNRSHRSAHSVGKLVKHKNTWPPIRSIGLSMELDHEAGQEKWFKFVHNAHYEQLERLCWVAEDSLDHRIIEEILTDNPYHLNSLLLLANIFRMQEDITQSCDLIERGIFYCEQAMASTFHASSFYHRIDYLDYENRAFYLLLHRHMMNCVHKRCFETALNYAKLILTMDPQRDPLAVMLIIDTIAIKAKQYKWLKDFYRCCKDWKNLDKLPNFCYSMALAQFLDSKTDEDSELADIMLSDAMCAFPGVVTVLLDKLQIEPDALVETHRHFGTFALNKESDGLKMIYKVYVGEIAEIWKVPETLSWLEHITRQCAQNENYQKEMDIWKEKRQRLFVGIPPNIRRLAVLLGFESSSSSVTDPVPPVNGRARYTRDVANPNRPDSFLSGFFHSIWPDYDSEEHLRDVLQRLREQMQQILFAPSTSSDQARPPEPDAGT